MLVTMETPISSQMKDKNSIFTARNEDMIFLVKGKILVFHQCLYNKMYFIHWTMQALLLLGLYQTVLHKSQRFSSNKMLIQLIQEIQTVVIL